MTDLAGGGSAMAHRIPTVRDGCLKDLTTNGKLAETIVVGTAEWYAWLEHHCSFPLETGCTGFTARKEQRPGGWYWYAYRRKQGKLRMGWRLALVARMGS